MCERLRLSVSATVLVSDLLCLFPRLDSLSTHFYNNTVYFNISSLLYISCVYVRACMYSEKLTV